MNYLKFLNSKVCVAVNSGFDVDDSELSECLKPHQREAVKWAVKGGCRALFERFGLGKTVQELEFCRLVIKHEGGQALIVMPLGVRQEFIHDAVELLKMPKPIYVRSMAEIKTANEPVLITNYERLRDGDIDPSCFTVVCLDEASVLRSFGSKTYQTFLPKFKNVKYKLVATATPDPNKYKEIIHYAGFLGVMDTGQALTRYFQRDSTKANNLTLYPHKEAEFWLWVSSWALFLSKPSDLGFDDEGYDLPPLEIRYHKLGSDVRQDYDRKTGQIVIANDAAESLTAAAREKRDSIPARIEKMKSIVDASPEDHFILWHDLEAERHAIKKALPEAVEVFGSQDIDIREKNVIDFSEGKIRLLATKKEISGQGCNFQKHCHRAIFVGIDYRFNDFIQAIHRIYRFLQTENVIIDIIYTENEQSVLNELLAKWQRFEHQQEKMQEIVKANGLSNNEIISKMTRSIGVKRVKIEGKNYTTVLNDCVQEVQMLPDNSIDLIHTSIPFSNHYEYTPSYNDTDNYETETERMPLSVTYSTYDAVALKTQYGIEFINRAHIHPFGDYSVRDIIYTLRTDESGNTYFAVKCGFMLIGILIPLKIITKTFIEELHAFKNQIEITFYCNEHNQPDNPQIEMTEVTADDDEKE